MIYTAHRLNLQYAPTADRQSDTFLIKLLQILAVCSIIEDVGLDRDRYWGFFELTDKQFKSIAQKGQVSNILRI